MLRSELQQLSVVRVRDAAALLAAGQFDGSYYLAGFAVEAALKACIAKATQRFEFPDRSRANSVFTHDLIKLLDEADLGALILYGQVTERGGRLCACYQKPWGHHAVGQKVLVMEQLSQEMIEEGRKLVQRLDAEGMKIGAALWLLDDDTGRWNLVLAAPDIRKAGPLALYRMAAKALVRMGQPDEIPIERVTIADPKSDLIRSVATAPLHSPEGLGHRVHATVARRQHVEDAYVYRWAARSRAPGPRAKTMH